MFVVFDRRPILAIGSLSGRALLSFLRALGTNVIHMAFWEVRAYYLESFKRNSLPRVLKIENKMSRNALLLLLEDPEASFLFCIEDKTKWDIITNTFAFRRRCRQWIFSNTFGSPEGIAWFSPTKMHRQSWFHYQSSRLN